MVEQYLFKSEELRRVLNYPDKAEICIIKYSGDTGGISAEDVKNYVDTQSVQLTPEEQAYISNIFSRDKFYAWDHTVDCNPRWDYWIRLSRGADLLTLAFDEVNKLVIAIFNDKPIFVHVLAKDSGYLMEMLSERFPNSVEVLDIQTKVRESRKESFHRVLDFSQKELELRLHKKLEKINK
jgi:hypothetical protein